MIFRKIALTATALLVTFALQAQTRSFPNCSKSQQRVDLDHFCPRMEGVHLEGCCPLIEKKPPLSCTYHILKERGQAVLVNSSYNTCQNGVDVSVPCCEISQRACYVSPVTLKYTPQLIYRDNQCCFDPCPPASYWRANPNPNPKISPDHELTGEGMSICTNTTLMECSLGSSASCQTSDYCPVVNTPVTPTTPSVPTTNTGTGMGTGTTTGSTPTTDTSPGPTDSTPVPPTPVDVTPDR